MCKMSTTATLRRLEEQREKIKRLDELCQLLSNQDAPVCDWFNAMDEQRSSIDPFTSIAFLDPEEKASLGLTVGFIPQLFTVLHDCILNLRWKEVLRVMNSIVHTCRGSSHTIWKVGNELLQREGNERLVRKLFEQTKFLSEIGAKDVVLEFAFYMMSCRRHESALANIKESVPRFNLARDRNEKGFYMNRLSRAYTGLMFYLEWKTMQTRLEQSRQEFKIPNQGRPLLMPTSFQPQQVEMRMNNSADKAVLCFKDLKGHCGVWDIFVTTHVELLLYQEKKEEALTLLQEYAELNKDNPNAQKYLYRFYKQHFPGSENVLKQLKVVIEMMPSDSLVLELCEDLQKDDLGMVCSYLFTLLDYACWNNVVEPWKTMSENLKTVFTAKPEIKAARKQVKTCWKTRKSWWPAYHFSVYNVRAGLDKSLLYHKALVAGLLIKPDNDFTTKAKKVLSIEEQKKLKKVFEKSKS